MFKFFLKKNFADGWDNLFFILVSNLITIAVLAGFGFLVRVAAGFSLLAALGTAVLALGVVLSLAFAWGAVARKIADFNAPSAALFFRSLKESWKTGLLFGVLLGVFALVIFVAVNYYLRLAFAGQSFGVFFALLLVVFALVTAMALQWFVPLYFLQEENTFKKCLKKSFIIFFDNTAFSVGVFLYNLALLALSCVLFFLLPGIHGITLSCMNALRLRLYKYDWLDEHPDYLTDRDKRADVPWGELLSDDKEALGERKLTSFLFPWK